MANEKILNTRVILKHDTLDNWNKETSIVLKEGEVALAKVTVNKQDPISGEKVLVPTYLIKVGDGTSKFSALNWVTAPAADVYDWAKKSEAEFTTWVKGLIDVGDIDLSDYYTKDETDGLLEALDNKKVDKVTGKGLSTNDLTDELKGQYDAAYAHSQVDHAPANAQENVIESVKINGTALTVTGKAVDITVPTVAGDVGAYTTTETDDKISEAIDGFIEAYITDDGGTIDKLNEIAAWIVDDEAGAAKVIADVEANAEAIAGEAATREQADTELSGRITKLENNEAGYATTGYVDQAMQQANTNKQAIEAINYETTGILAQAQA